MRLGDSLRIGGAILEYGLGASSAQRYFSVGSESFVFKFDPIRVPSQIQIRVDTIRNGKNIPLMISDVFLIEPGDTIILSKNGRKVSYSGTDRKISLLQEVDKIGTILKKKRWQNVEQIRPVENDYNYLDSVTILQLLYLEQIKDQISTTAYSLSKIDILCSNLSFKRHIERRVVNKDNYLKLRNFYNVQDANFGKAESIRKSLANYYDRIAEELKSARAKYSFFFPYSKAYSSLIKLNYEKDSCIIPDSPFDLRKYYCYLKNNFGGLLRERLLVDFVFSNISTIDDRGFFIRDAMPYIKNHDFVNYLLKISTGVKGDPAYNFTLPDLSGNKVSMESLKGKVVVMDFWGTGCGPCIKLHPIFDKVVDYFSDNSNIIFLSVSLDEDSLKWRNSVMGGKYTCTSKPNLLNIYTDGLGHNHPMIKYHNIRGIPAMVLVNSIGNIEENPTDPWSEDGKGLIKKIELLIKAIPEAD
ncbi:MAG: TlpA family protein disulfide reductase [Sphingobacteriia bacterium]|nr:TlpA family protein disulfide reductase [Sphingobacteriia bacterium]